MFRGLLLAPPGAGKGTQGERLAEQYGAVHIATGDVLRSQVERGTALGRQAKDYMDAGRLVPDHLVINMVLDQLGGEEPLEDFLLDGFPRNLRQAKAAYEWGESNGRTFDAVIMLEVPEEELVRRLVQRGVERGRSDDTEDVIRHRLRVYAEDTAPLIEYYENRGILLRVDGTGTVDEVTDRLRTALDKILAA